MTFNPTEKHQSQIPALQLLVALGFTPLSQKAALAARGNRLSNVLLDDILADQLLKINRFAHRGREYHFDLEDAHEAIRRLRPRPDKAKGLRGTNQEVYDLLVLGTTITQRIDGDTKSYSFRYIDWEDPANNLYHVTAEMAVERTGSVKTRRCDVVAFVNGIPFVVAENKRPTEKSEKAGSQLIGYQKEVNIPHLFHFAQLLLALNRQDGRYATVGTAAKFWQGWRTSMSRAAESPSITTDAPPPPPPHTTPSPLQRLVNRPLAVTEARAVYSGDFTHARPYFDALSAEGSRSITIQDRTIHALCRPERLLDLVRRFTVFDGGVRKIARHQQYFAVHRAMERVKHFDLHGRRKGGVIWHTQGSGKSLTMVMLGRALALDHEIVNPRIIIVTDRRDLDRQIKDTFKSCEMEPVRARSGRHLLQLIPGPDPTGHDHRQQVRNGAPPCPQVRPRPQHLRAGRRKPPVSHGPSRSPGASRRPQPAWEEHAAPSAEGMLPRFHRHAAAEQGKEHLRHVRRAHPPVRDRSGRRGWRRRAPALRRTAGRPTGHRRHD